MKIKKLLEAYTSLQYIGTSVDNMAQIVENSIPADFRDVMKRMSPDVVQNLPFNITDIVDAGNHNYIWWLYDDATDTYHFFEE
jgi:hypothetical protein